LLVLTIEIKITRSARNGPYMNESNNKSYLQCPNLEWSKARLYYLGYKHLDSKTTVV